MDITTLTSWKFWVPGIILLAVLVLLATSPLYLSSYVVVLLTAILMYTLLTVSWAMFSGPTGYISLASAGFFGAGIYTAALAGNTLPLPLVICVAGLASLILALFIGLLTLRLRGIYFTVFTFGFVELIKRFLLWWEMTVTRTRGRFVVIVDDNTIYYVMFAILVATLLTAYFLRRSKFGLALQSIGENEEAAAHSGVNVTLVKVVAFAISALFMGAAGAIMATKWTYVDPYIAFDTIVSFMPVLMAIFGGLGQFYGPIIGAAVFAYLQEFLRIRFPFQYMLVFGIVLVVVILFMPHGLVGLVRKRRATFNRMMRAAMLDVNLYEEVKADTQLTQEALIVVILVSIASGIGFLGGMSIGPALGGLTAVVLLGVSSYYIWAYVTYSVGTNLFKGTVDVGDLLRTLGYARGPLVLGVLVFIPYLGSLAVLAGAIWALVASVFAGRQALGFDTPKAILIVVIGGVITTIIIGGVIALIVAVSIAAPTLLRVLIT